MMISAITQKFTKKSLLVLAIIGIAIIAVALQQGKIFANPTATISGTVTTSSGTGVSDVSVYATAPGGSTTEYGPVTTDVNGNYSLPVQTGTYDIHFNPASGSGISAVVKSNISVSSDTTLDVQFASQTYTLSGTLTDQNGNPLPNYYVGLSNSSNSGSFLTDSNGNYSVSVVPGTYNLNISELTGQNSIDHFQVSNMTPTIDLSSGNASKNLTLDLAAVHVTLEDASGNPVPNTKIVAEGTGTVNVSGYTGSNALVISTDATTDSNGEATIETAGGIGYPAGNGDDRLCAQTEPMACLASATTITGDTNVTLQEPQTYTFSGKLTDQNGNPLPNYYVGLSNSSNSGSALTDSNGNYSVSVAPGTYNLDISELTGQNGMDHFTVSGMTPTIDLSSNTSQNLTLNLAAVNVTVEDANGNPVPNTKVVAEGTGTVNVSGYTGSNALVISTDATTNSSGEATIETVDGIGYPAGNNDQRLCAETEPVTCLASATTITGDTNITLQEPQTYTLSGTLTDQNGNPLPNFYVGLNNGPNGASGSALTDSNGNYSVSVVPGTYNLNISEVTSQSGMDSFSVSDMTPAIDLSSGNASKNLTLDLAAVHVTLENTNGTPLPNTKVVAEGTGTVNVSGYTGSNALVISTDATTDSNGNATIETVDGIGYPAGNNDQRLCAETEPLTCLASATTITGDTNIVLQEPVTPNAPTNLAATSPTNTSPALSWDASTGATSYNIYRNGTNIGSTSSTTYTDTGANSNGTYSYYVTAVNSSGESSPSNTIDVSYLPSPNYTLVNLSDSNGNPLSDAKVVWQTPSGTAGTTYTDSFGNTYFDTTAGTTYTVDVYYANGYVKETIVPTSSGPNIVDVSTIAVTATINDSSSSDLSGASISQAGNTGTFGSKQAVNSSGQVVFQVLPGTNYFTAYDANGYEEQSLNVSSTNNTISFDTYQVVVTVDKSGNPLTTATVDQAGNSGTYGSKEAVNSDGQITFNVLPGNNYFIAWDGTNYAKETLDVTANTSTTINVN